MKTHSSFPVKKPRAFPFKACRGNAVVTIYYRQYVRGTEAYNEFRIPIIEGGARKFVLFSKYKPARNYATEKLFSLSHSAELDVTLKESEAAAYRRALETVKPLGLPIDGVALRYAEAVKALEGVSVSLVEAARFYARRNPVDVPDKSVADSVKEFIQSAEARECGDRHIEDLNYRLGKFSDQFGAVGVNRVDSFQLRDFMDKLDLSPRSYNNFRRTLASLFKFAKARRFLPADWNEFASVERMRDKGGDIGIFTPKQMALLLTHAPERLIPYLAIGAFAGVRSAEIERLEWEDVRFATGNIHLEKAKAKTAARRIIPLLPNLKAWLAHYGKHTGPVSPFSRPQLYAELKATALAAKVPWKSNALRHSFISYRVAQTQNVNQVALEAGNSIAMIHGHYRELVTPEDAKDWFSLQPGEAGQGKVIHFKAA